MTAQKGYYDSLETSAAKTMTVLDTCSVGGAAVNPTLPAFLAWNSVTDSNVTGDGTVVTVQFDTEVFDLASNFANNIFTAPVTGKYRFSVSVQISDLDTNHTSRNVELITSNRAYTIDVATLASNPFTTCIMNGSVICDMDAGDTAMVNITVSGGSKVVEVGGSVTRTFFCGELVC